MPHIFSFARLLYPLCIVTFIFVIVDLGTTYPLLYFSVQHILVVQHCSWTILPNVTFSGHHAYFINAYMNHLLCYLRWIYGKNNFWDSLDQWYRLWHFCLIKVLDTNTKLNAFQSLLCHKNKTEMGFCIHKLIFKFLLVTMSCIELSVLKSPPPTITLHYTSLLPLLATLSLTTPLPISIYFCFHADFV